MAPSGGCHSPSVGSCDGAGRLEPQTTKNDEGRSFPFAVLPRFEAVLRKQRAMTTKLERETGRVIRPVFHRDGEPIKELRGTWKTACNTAGLPGRIVHDFRRTAVRNLERGGVPRSVAMKLTGPTSARRAGKMMGIVVTR